MFHYIMHTYTANVDPPESHIFFSVIGYLSHPFSNLFLFGWLYLCPLIVIIKLQLGFFFVSKQFLPLEFQSCFLMCLQLRVICVFNKHSL